MSTSSSVSYLDLAYRPDLDLVVIRWMLQPTVAEIQQGYSLALNIAAQHQCCRWLVDARRRDHSNKESSQWMMDSFFPQLPARLPGKVFMAFLFAPLHLQDLETDTALPSLTYFDGLPYQVERFTEEQTATAWLNTCCAPQPLGVAVGQW